MKDSAIVMMSIIIQIFPQVLLGQASNEITYGEKHSIYSEIIGENKEYWVHLPMNYDASSERYPVMYITDGDEHFFLASGITQFMSSQYQIPEMVVVAIFHEDRNHDLTPTHVLADNDGFESDALKVSGGGEKLLQFIEKELIAQIENDYRTGSYRIFAGHSLGGLFSVYAYLSRGDLFDAFISMDPALNWDNYFCERTLKALPTRSPNFQNKLYISSAHNAPPDKPDLSPFRKSQNAFYKELKARQGVESKHEYFEKENHLTVPYQSLYAGLSYIFSDYYLFSNPKFEEDVSFIREHYRSVSNSYGMKFIPPEGMIEMLGNYFMLDRNEYTRAIEFFELNTVNYPGSYKAYENLAKAYKAAGKVEDAISCLNKSLELHPDNSKARQLLMDLEAK